MGDLTKPGRGLHCFLSDPLDSHMAAPSCKGGHATCAQEKKPTWTQLTSLSLSSLICEILHRLPVGKVTAGTHHRQV